jgi:hypothetical protein
MAAQGRGAGEIIAFEVMAHPIEALAAPGEETGNRIGPQLSLRKHRPACPADFCRILMTPGAARALAHEGALWQGSAALAGPFWADSRIPACCRSSVVEHSIGNGEVDSSILSGSTSFSLVKAFQIGMNAGCRLAACFHQYQPFRPEQIRKACAN